MVELEALAALLISLSESYHELAQTCSDLAACLDPAHIAGADALALARAIQGEEAGLFGAKRDELGIWIAHTALNRWEKAWWKQIDGVPCTFAARVEYDWHGTALVDEEDVEPWAVRIAQQALVERRAGGPDRASGALFAMTLDDLKYHGWTQRAGQLVVGVVSAPGDPLVQFWFLSDHPAEEH